MDLANNSRSNNSIDFMELYKLQFGLIDYVLLIFLLALSTAIGIYYGCFGSKQSSVNKYVSGDKKMTIISISASTIASNISSLTLIAVPAEVYQFGSNYLYTNISLIISNVISSYIFLPMFFKLQSISIFEYLEKRFSRPIRLLASALNIAITLMYLPTVMYLPCLAFSTVSGVSLNIMVPIASGICIFYTTIGGLKTVVWSDFLQLIVMFGCIVTILVISIEPVGGFVNLWNKTVEGGRLNIWDFDTDPTKRDSFWILVIGYSVHIISHSGTSQSYVLKFLALPHFNAVKTSVVCSVIGIAIFQTISVVMGCIIYVLYGKCDPFKTKILYRNDQLLPYHLSQIGRAIPGLSGLFIAGVFSASLSTFSAALNALSASIYDDFLKTHLPTDLSSKTICNILKALVVVIGVCTTSLIYIIQHLGSSLGLVVSLLGCMIGSQIALFTLGMVFPMANSKGTIYGTIITVVLLVSLIFPSKYYQYMGVIKPSPLPTSIDQCYFQNNSRINIIPEESINYSNDNLKFSQNAIQPFFLFRISHYYYSLIGFIINIIAGLLISLCTRKQKHEVDPDLIAPIGHYFFLKKQKINKNGNYTLVQQGIDRHVYLKKDSN